MAGARAVGVRELRQNLSVHLARVKRGATLTVTEHGQVVAILRPAPSPGDLVDRLVAEGRATRARRPLSSLPSPLRVKLKTSLGREIDALRDDTI